MLTTQDVFEFCSKSANFYEFFANFCEKMQKSAHFWNRPQIHLTPFEKRAYKNFSPKSQKT